MTANVYIHRQASIAVPGQKHEYSINEEFKSKAIKREDYISFVGCTTMSSAYPKNHSFLAKLGFLKARGYTIKGMKYGIAFHNQIFDTLYLLVIPRFED